MRLWFSNASDDRHSLSSCQGFKRGLLQSARTPTTNCLPPRIFPATYGSRPGSAAHKLLPRSPTAQNRFRASKRSSVREISTLPPPNNWSVWTAPSISPPGPPKRSFWLNAARHAGLRLISSHKQKHAPDAASFLVTTSSALAHEGSTRSENGNSPNSPLGFREFVYQARWRNFLLRNHSKTLANSSIASRQSISACLPMKTETSQADSRCRHDFPRSVGPLSRSAIMFSGSKSRFCRQRVWGTPSRRAFSAADFVKCISVQTISRKGFSASRPIAAEIFSRSRRFARSPQNACKDSPMKIPLASPAGHSQTQDLRSSRGRPRKQNPPRLQRKYRRLRPRPSSARFAKTHFRGSSRCIPSTRKPARAHCSPFRAFEPKELLLTNGGAMTPLRVFFDTFVEPRSYILICETNIPDVPLLRGKSPVHTSRSAVTIRSKASR